MTVKDFISLIDINDCYNEIYISSDLYCKPLYVFHDYDDLLQIPDNISNMKIISFYSSNKCYTLNV